MHLGTFTIIARCDRTREFGVATATAAPCVGAFVPFVELEVGAVATQAWVNVNLGRQGVELMRLGLGAKTAIEALLSEDRERHRRQVIAIDPKSAHGFTGSECTDAKGHIVARDFAVAGNILSDTSVLDRMASAYANEKGDLGRRLLAALREGERAGGDHRGKLSAALVIASPRPMLFHNLRVDHSADPVRELERLYSVCEVIQEEQGDDDDSEVLRPRVPRVVG
jgi:uncharacterized Ntn-hydrolase superfamily protein